MARPTCICHTAPSSGRTLAAAEGWSTGFQEETNSNSEETLSIYLFLFLFLSPWICTFDHYTVTLSQKKWSLFSKTNSNFFKPFLLTLLNTHTLTCTKPKDAAPWPSRLGNRIFPVSRSPFILLQIVMSTLPKRHAHHLHFWYWHLCLKLLQTLYEWDGSSFFCSAYVRESQSFCFVQLHLFQYDCLYSAVVQIHKTAVSVYTPQQRRLHIFSTVSIVWWLFPLDVTYAIVFPYGLIYVSWWSVRLRNFSFSFF